MYCRTGYCDSPIDSVPGGASHRVPGSGVTMNTGGPPIDHIDLAVDEREFIESCRQAATGNSSSALHDRGFVGARPAGIRS